MVKSKKIMKSKENQAVGDAKSIVERFLDDLSVYSETEGYERSQTNSWLREKGLSEFVQKLKSEKLEIETLFECSRDELFEIFKSIGLKSQECVRLRFAVTSDKRWKGGLDFLFALKEKTYKEVQKISKELAKSSAILSKVQDAETAVNKTCDDYLKEVTAAVEKIRTEACLKVESVRNTNEDKMKALTDAQREIHSVVKNFPIHDDKARDEGFSKILEKVQNQLQVNAEFRVGELNYVKPDIRKLKKAVSSYFAVTEKPEQFMWDAEWTSSYVSLNNKGQTATVAPCDVYRYALVARGTSGWVYGNHRWRMRVDAGQKDCGCYFEDSCGCGYYPVCLGVCAESLSKNEIQSTAQWSKTKTVGFYNDNCYPLDKFISGYRFTLNAGDILDLTLDLSVRTLKIKSECNGSTMVVKVPEGKIYPWVGFVASRYSSTSVTIIN